MLRSASSRVGVLSILAVVGSGFPVLANHNNPPPARNGSTASNGSTCHVCHGNTLGAGSVNVFVTPSAADVLSGQLGAVAGPAAVYTPGALHNVVIQVCDATKVAAGFQLSVEDATGANVGAVAITDPTNTQLNPLDTRWANHTGNGVFNSSLNWAASGNCATFTLAWQAPPSLPGLNEPATFWAAGNAVNLDGDLTLDLVYLTNRTLAPDCNGNGIPDAQDIANGTLHDADGNGTPDECDRGSCCFGLGTPNAGCLDNVLRAECGDDEPPPLVFTPGGICDPGCCGCVNDIACDDNDACTREVCFLACICQRSLIPGFDPATECCNPVSGVQQPLDDGDLCTLDTCTSPNSRGSAAHTPIPLGSACNDSNPCTYGETCDNAGTCAGTDVNGEACTSDGECQNGGQTPGAICDPPGGGVCQCSVPAPVVLSGGFAQHNRALAFEVNLASTASATAGQSALRVTIFDLQEPDPPNAPCCPPPDFGAYEVETCTAVGEMNGCARWVGPPQTFLESNDNPGQGSFRASRLQCTPYYCNWTAEAQVMVAGAEILASSIYEVQAFAATCKGAEAACGDVSSPVLMATNRWGDVAAPFNPPSASTQPDGLDVTAMVSKFKNAPGSPSKVVAQLQPNAPDPNTDVSALDILVCVDAFKGFAYPYSGPCPCPSTVPCNVTPCANASVCDGGTCVKTCTGGDYDAQPCVNNTHCPNGTCGSGSCRDRCGRCSP